MCLSFDTSPLWWGNPFQACRSTWVEDRFGVDSVSRKEC